MKPPENVMQCHIPMWLGRVETGSRHDVMGGILDQGYKRCPLRCTVGSKLLDLGKPQMSLVLISFVYFVPNAARSSEN